MARIYHNPKCSTSRKTLDLLRENGIEPEVVQYLKTPPTRAELVTMIAEAGIDVRTAVRKRTGHLGELGHGRTFVSLLRKKLGGGQKDCIFFGHMVLP